MQIAYAFYTKECTIDTILKELNKSLSMTRSLYAKMLMLPVELKNIAERKFSMHQNQTKASDIELEKMKRIMDNYFFKALEEDKNLADFCKAQKVSWSTQDDFLLNLYNSAIDSDLMNSHLKEEFNLATQKKFTENFFTKCLADSEIIAEELELQNLYWNDDFIFILPVLQKAVRKSDEETNEVFFPNQHKSKDDKVFAESLLLKVIRQEERNKKLVESITPNWEYERIALIDRLLIGMAIAELMEFETIPVKVTLNEYVEISKYYSTENSSVFINGILDKIAKQENAIKLKKGIGLL